MALGSGLELPLRALAPAKVNLCLYVGQPRGDGLHEICSIFQSITLADVVTMAVTDVGEDEVVCPRVPEPNLAAVALARFRERFGWDAPPLRIAIDKRIPMAAGLGGGSADAAAVLRLACAASGIEPAPGELEELAMSLGADVPSQLESGTCLVTGAGEHVERLETPKGLALVLLAGTSALPTSRVYARSDGYGLPAHDLAELADTVRASIGRARRAADVARLVHNDLQRAALALEPTITGALALLDEAGALAGTVSGSGPTAFGLFAGGADAEAARRQLVERWEGETVVAAPAPPGYGDPEPAATS
jgi:4-diphosphocytidyl-2-C-methyl-D-erythritol kinase